VYLSFYTGRLGLFTAGAFYKKMEDQVLDYTITIIDPEEYNLPPAYKNKTMEQPVNNRWPGYITGIELDWQTQFSFLPKPFNGITLNANLTMMKSETRYPFYSFEATMIPDPPYKIYEGKHDSRVNKVTGMPDRVANLALGYELGGFSGRISAYYQSATITTAQASNKSIDEDKDAILRMDLQLSQKIRKMKGLTFYLNINNLTNSPDRSILTYHHDRVTSEERYGFSCDVGVRYQF
jgi:outer membrane receptor protein involved in Fe transport